MYLQPNEEYEDTIMDNPLADIPVLVHIGPIKVVDNKDFKLAARSTTPGESCANCSHYSVYDQETDPIEHNEDNEPIYVGPIVLRGACTSRIPDNLFVFNIPSDYHCPFFEKAEVIYVDDTITDDMEGREV
jgi:hypothetical protein